MKNNNLFLLVAAVFALISCGTANRSAQYSGTQFRNSIYYTPDSTKTLFGHAMEHFSQPSQSSVLMSMWHSSTMSSSFFPLLKNEPKPMVNILGFEHYYNFGFDG